jgi:hypothetical protein
MPDTRTAAWAAWTCKTLGANPDCAFRKAAGEITGGLAVVRP